MLDVPTTTPEQRRRLMRALARTDGARIRQYLATLGALPAYEVVRRPQIGLTMLRGRVAGAGAPFNLGEASVARAAVRLDGGELGVSYALGRDADKALDCAVLDALIQLADWRERVDAHVLAPLESALEARDEVEAAKIAATRVDFFTLVRGDD